MAAGAANLYSELLLALLGHTGDAFVCGDQGNIALSDVVDWVTPPEREQLNRLARLGVHYAALEAFVEVTSASAAEGLGIGAGAGAPTASLYRLALATGVSELLDVYRSAVLQVEAHLQHLPAAAPPPPLLSVQQFLLEFDSLLPEVQALVGEVERRGLGGAGVMALLAARAHAGAPALQSCAERLLWHCRQVLFKQLESWLVHGLLLDQAGEFFIHRAGSAGGAGARPPGGSPSPLRLERGGAGEGGSALDWEPLEWHAGFQVSVPDLPPGVSLPTAETALFIGKAVRVLKQPMSAAASHQALRAHAEILGFSEALRRLQRRDAFSAVQFDHCIETMRAKVSGLLWDLVQHRCDLMGQFEAVRNYFLLGRGDFYQQFLDEVEPLLAAPPKPNTAEADVALAFQQSALKSTAETDATFAAVSLRWMPPDQARLPAGEGGAPAWHPARCAAVTVPRCDAWDGLFLECAVEWPLQLLFPPEVMSKYGALWQHMFRLRRVQLALEGAWATLQELQRVRPDDDPLPRLPAALRTALWLERQQQHHFVFNMSLYLARDVVGASFEQLRSAIAAARDFSAADAAHRQYVDSLVSQAFLDVRQLMVHLEDVLLQCRELCGLVQRLADGAVSAEQAEETLRQLSRTFQLKQRILYQMLQSGKMGGRAPALRQLITRLNFNHFSERQAWAGRGRGAAAATATAAAPAAAGGDAGMNAS